MVLNKPNSIRDCPEKLFVMDFFNLMPPTLISKQKSNIIKFVNKFKKVEPLSYNLNVERY